MMSFTCPRCGQKKTFSVSEVSAPNPAHPSGESPKSLRLDLLVRDQEIVDELKKYPEGESRSTFALLALRVGILFLKHCELR